MNFRFVPFLLVLLVATMVLPSLQGQEVRKVTNIDADWKFFLGDDQNAKDPAFNDASWRKLNVPHDWSIEGTIDQNAPSASGGGFMPTGIGWYRKDLVIPASEKGKRLFIRFDGVMANSDVWVNGQHLGHRPYGYSGFEYELTGKVTFGASNPNIVSVRADNLVQPASRWYTGCGIYRHVYLVSVNPVHLEHWGVFITTPSISTQQATVSVQSSVVNQSAKSAKVTVQTVVSDADGKTFTSATKAVTVAAGDTVMCSQEIVVSSPKIWDLETPNLYKAVTTVLSGRKAVDDMVNTFGIRDARFESETGFTLNGRSVKIKGVCLHHDGGPVGSAVPAEVWRRRFEILKTIGVNGIRVSHNPMDPVFYDLADQMGFLVMDESFDTWTAAKPRGEKGYNLYFREWWDKDTRAMVMRDRNHPSIVIYSVGNEIRDRLNSERGRQDLLNQRDLIRQLDPTRPITMALFNPAMMQVYTNGFSELLDVIGQNYRDDEIIAAWKAKPGRKIISTENVHDARSWLLARDNAFHAGQYVWTGLEYLGEGQKWPNVGWGTALLDRNAFWRPLGYQRQSWWSDKPMVKMVRKDGNAGEGKDVMDWTPADMGTYDIGRVSVYSNCEEVELFLNGESKGRLPINANLAPRVWDVDFAPGVIKAVGFNKGQQVAVDEMKTADAPVKVLLTSERPSVKNCWDDIVYVKATVVDKNGLRNPNADHKLTFKISGPGVLVAVDNGSPTSHEPYKTNVRSVDRGEAVALIQANANSGKITLTVSAEGLEGSAVTIDAVPGK